jgi:hypothetical protein
VTAASGFAIFDGSEYRALAAVGGQWLEVTGNDIYSGDDVPGDNAAAVFNLLFTQYPGVVGFLQNMDCSSPIVAQSACGIRGPGDWTKTATFGPSLHMTSLWSPGAQSPFGIVVPGTVDGFMIDGVTVNARDASALLTPCQQALGGTGARVRARHSGFLSGSGSVVRPNGQEWRFGVCSIRQDANGLVAFEQGTASDCQVYGGLIEGGQGSSPSVHVNAGSQDFQMIGTHVVKSNGSGPTILTQGELAQFVGVLIDDTGDGSGAVAQVSVGNGYAIFAGCTGRNNAGAQNIPFMSVVNAAVAQVNGLGLEGFGQSWTKLCNVDGAGSLAVFTGPILIDKNDSGAAALDSSTLATSFTTTNGGVVDYSGAVVYRKATGAWSKLT